jgi:hypothetical protein
MIQSLENYGKTSHKLFTHALVKINDKKIVSIYKNKGYTEKSSVYGVIFQIHSDEKTLSFKTKKQVEKFLINQNE